MSNQGPLVSQTASDEKPAQSKQEPGDAEIPSATPPEGEQPPNSIVERWSSGQNRLFEVGLFLSMTLYYTLGNERLGKNFLFHINPLFSLPFLLMFIILCWYRLPLAIALFPLTLPFYLYQKTLFAHYAFSPAEITLGVCLLVALLQLVIQRGRWPYLLSWRELRARIGPFGVPILVFFIAAALSISIAYDKVVALRYFRLEILDPLLYLLLLLSCLRSLSDLKRLLFALLSTGLMVALAGLAQYLFFRHSIVPDIDGLRRISAMYGSGNSIGLVFDYILPVGMAFVLAKFPSGQDSSSVWRGRMIAGIICLLMLIVLYLSQSQGSWFAIAVAALFVFLLSIRKRQWFWAALPIVIVLLGVGIYIFISHDSHVDANGISTATKRLYIWRSALDMVHDSPWLGYGMNNWVCHYSHNAVCLTPHMHHYMISRDPVTLKPTDLQYEPDLSHPHNVFLHVWVSMGIFGLLAFITILLLFFWQIVRFLVHLRARETADTLPLQWMTLGVGAAMLAAMAQGLVDSAFLEQDLAFCFWILIAALMLLRLRVGISWRSQKRVRHAG